jgi:nucleotide-binding universal stress UspA family protein
MGDSPITELDLLLVPLDGSKASLRALAVACEIARRRKTCSVSAVHVIEVPRRLPVEADLIAELDRGERILEQAEAVAKEHGVTLDGDLLQARQAGPAIVDEATERGADAIVMGVDYHRPHGAFQLGRLPEYALVHASCEVWLIRYPSEGTPEREAAATEHAAERDEHGDSR